MKSKGVIGDTIAANYASLYRKRQDVGADKRCLSLLLFGVGALVVALYLL